MNDGMMLPENEIIDRTIIGIDQELADFLLDANERIDGKLHMSMAGGCFRKNWLNCALGNEGLRMMMSYEHLRMLGRCQEVKRNDEEFKGVVSMGKLWHTLIDRVFASSQHAELVPEEKRGLRLEISGTEIIGTMDSPMVFTKHSDHETVIEIKSVSKGKKAVKLDKDMVGKSWSDGKSIIWTRPDIKESYQLTTYLMAMHKPEILGFILHICRDDMVRFWSKVDWTDLEVEVRHYWGKMIEYYQKRIIPEAVPYEGWECSWAKGKNGCNYRFLCFPNKFTLEGKDML